MRIAAVGDVHIGEDSRGLLRPALERLPEHADVLLLAGDLTQLGTPAEARAAAAEFSNLDVPVVAVLGNHDYHHNAEVEIRSIFIDSGIPTLDAVGATALSIGDRILGVVGGKGFGGGFAGACGSVFGEPQMKSYVQHTVDIADRIRGELAELEADVVVGLLHYSPVADTLMGEPREIFPFLGSYLLAEPFDEYGADLIVHGHAHRGTEKGRTAGGTPVRNVAQHVIGSAYAVYRIDRSPVALGVSGSDDRGTRSEIAPTMEGLA